MYKIIAIASGGAIGSVLRYVVSGLTHRFAGAIFPWGTLVVNIVGCFLIGFLWEIFSVQSVSSTVRLFVLVGILGGFTTFSTYAYESLNMFREGETQLALMNIFLSNFLGIAFVLAGLTAARYMIAAVK